MFSTATEDGVTVDSNVGSSDELKAELATETPSAKPRAGKLTTIAEPKVKTGQAADDQAATNADDAAANADAVTDTEASKAGQALTKKRGSLQARIDEITAERHTTARERDQARAEVANLRAELDALKGGKPKDAPAEKKTVGGVALDVEKFPKYEAWLKSAPDDANDLEDWVEARDAWKAAKTEETQAAERAKTEHSEKFTTTARTFHERMAPVLKADPKFYDKVDQRLLNTPAASALPPGQKPNFGNFIVEQAIRSEHPKDLLLWLSEPETIRRLVTLQPDEIIREFTKKELSIRPADDVTGPSADEHDDDEETDADADRQARRGSRSDAAATSQASPPIKPVRGSSQQSADQEPGDDASDDEWLRYERRKQATKRRPN